MLKTKVSWAFIFALLQLFMSFGNWLKLAVSILFIVGLFLLYTEKPQSKAVLAAGSLLLALCFVRMLPVNIIGSYAIRQYISICVESGIAWAAIPMLASIVILIADCIILCLRVLSGNGTKGKKIWGFFAFIFVFCTIINFMSAVVSNGYFFSPGLASGQAVSFVLLMLTRRDLNPEKRNQKHSIIFALILAIVLNVAVGLAPGLFAGGGGGGSSYTCQSCGRSFSSGTDDSRSVSRTNMCSNCYGNFNSLKDFLD